MKIWKIAIIVLLFTAVSCYWITVPGYRERVWYDTVLDVETPAIPVDIKGKTISLSNGSSARITEISHFNLPGRPATTRIQMVLDVKTVTRFSVGERRIRTLFLASASELTAELKKAAHILDTSGEIRSADLLP